MGQGLFDGDRCVGIADTLLVLIDEAKRLPLPIPDAVRAGLLAGGHRSA
jgi:acyl-CoA thioesterase FadM